MQLQRQLRVVDSINNKQTSLKVAFATNDMKQVNQHFGSAKSFAIYAIGCEQATLLEVVQFGRLDQDGNEDKLAVKMEALKECSVVYSQAVGSSAVQQLLRLNIQPVRVELGSQIYDLIKALQEDLVNGPSAWVAKALAKHSRDSAKRFDFMELDEWQE